MDNLVMMRASFLFVGNWRSLREHAVSEKAAVERNGRTYCSASWLEPFSPPSRFGMPAALVAVGAGGTAKVAPEDAIEVTFVGEIPVEGDGLDGKVGEA